MNPQNNHKKLRLLAAALILIGFSLFLSRNSNDLPTNSAKWQAVFLTDGQVYFGKLENKNSRFALLKNVYYLKFAEGLQQEKTGMEAQALSGRNLNLIKLGGEAHGPENEMSIAKDKILFIENLKETSTVVQAIVNNTK